MQRSIILFCLVLSFSLGPGSVVSQSATPAASPVASPVTVDACTGLEAYFLDLAGPFTSLAAAQSAVDAWVADYNLDRPHQALDDQLAGHPGRAVPPGS